MQETWVWSLGQEGSLEEGVVTHSSILAWRIPWTEEPGGLQSIESQRVGHDWHIRALSGYFLVSFLSLAAVVAVNSVLWGFQSVRLWLFHLSLSYSVWLKAFETGKLPSSSPFLHVWMPALGHHLVSSHSCFLILPRVSSDLWGSRSDGSYSVSAEEELCFRSWLSHLPYDLIPLFSCL